MVPVVSVMLMKKQNLIKRAALNQLVVKDKCLCRMVLAHLAQTGQNLPQIDNHADQTHAH